MASREKAKTKSKARRVQRPWVAPVLVVVGLAGVVWGFANTPMFHPQHLAALRKQHAELFARAEVVTLPSVPYTLRLGGNEKMNSIRGYFHFGNITAEAVDGQGPAPSVRWAVPQGQPWPDAMALGQRGAAQRPVPPMICELTFPPGGEGTVRRFSVQADVSYPHWAGARTPEVIRKQVVEQHTVFMPTDPAEIAVLADYEQHVAKQAYYKKAGNWGSVGGVLGMLVTYVGLSGFVEARRGKRARGK